MGRGAPVLSPQDAHRSTRSLPHAASTRRIVRLLQEEGIRVRFLRRRTFVDEHKRRAGDERGQVDIEQTQEQLHRGHRGWCHHGRDGVRGDEQRRIPEQSNDRGAQRQRTGEFADGDSDCRGDTPGESAQRVHQQPIGIEAVPELSRLRQGIESSFPRERPGR